MLSNSKWLKRQMDQHVVNFLYGLFIRARTEMDWQSKHWGVVFDFTNVYGSSNWWLKYNVLELQGRATCKLASLGFLYLESPRNTYFTLRCKVWSNTKWGSNYTAFWISLYWNFSGMKISSHHTFKGAPSPSSRKQNQSSCCYPVWFDSVGSFGQEFSICPNILKSKMCFFFISNMQHSPSGAATANISPSAAV